METPIIQLKELSPDNFDSLVATSEKCLKIKLEEKVEKILWAEFERASTDATMQSVINITLRLGFEESSEQMEDKMLNLIKEAV